MILLKKNLIKYELSKFYKIQKKKIDIGFIKKSCLLIFFQKKPIKVYTDNLKMNYLKFGMLSEILNAQPEISFTLLTQICP